MAFYAGRPHDRSSKGLCRRDIADNIVPWGHNADLMVIEKSFSGLADTERSEIIAAHDGQARRLWASGAGEGYPRRFKASEI